MQFPKSFEHNEALFQAAIVEFSSMGFEQASINTILAKAGMSKGQFYYHFANKQGLYFSLIEVLIACKKEYMAGVLRPEDFGGDIFTILQTQIRLGVGFAKAHPDINKFSESFLKEKGKPIYDAVLEKYNFESDAGLNQLIAFAHERGDFREDLPLSFIQKTIGYLFTHVADLTDLTGTENAELNLERLITFIKTGLANPAAPSQE